MSISSIPAAQGAYGAQGTTTGGSTPASRVRSYAQNKYNYQLSDNELNEVAGVVGWDPVQGGTPTEDHYKQAEAYIDKRFSQTSGSPAKASTSGVPSPPAGYSPSVNRDGTIPDPAPVAAPAAAPSPTAATGPGLQAGATTFSGVDPARQFAPQDALAEVERQVGRKLTQAEINEALQMVGPGPYTGAHINQLLQVAASRTPNATFSGFQPPAGAAPGGIAPGTAGLEELVRAGLQKQANTPDFVDPTDPAVRAQLNTLISAILANPESLNPQVVAQLKEAQKEQILAANQQLQGEIGQNAASRGTFGGGNMQALQRRAADATTSEYARAARDIDINAAASNLADRHKAAGLGDSYLTAGLTRGLAVAGHNADQQNSALGNALQAWQVGTQRDLGDKGLGLDQQRIDNQASQFGQAHKLDWARVLNDMIMGRANYGVNLAQLQQGTQNSMFDWLFQGRG